MDSLKCNVHIVLSLVLTQVLDKKAINTYFLYMDRVCSSLLHAKTKKKETRYSPCSLGLHSFREGENNLPASNPPNFIIIHRAFFSLDLRRDHINSLFLSNVSWTQYFLLCSFSPPLQSRPIKRRLAIPNQWMTNSMGYLEELLCQP